MIKPYKNDVTKENIKNIDINKRSSNWPESPDHPYRKLIIAGSES